MRISPIVAFLFLHFRYMRIKSNVTIILSDILAEEIEEKEDSADINCNDCSHGRSSRD